MNNDIKIIPLSKTKIFLLTAGALVFVAIGIWMYQLDSAWISAQKTIRSPALVHGSGILSVMLGGLFGVFGIRKLIDTKPGLVLSAAGMLDNSSGASAGFIPWSEIQGFEISQIQKQRLLIVKLTDPQKYIQAAKPMKQSLYKMNMKMFGSPVSLSSNSLKIGFDELVSVCRAYLTKYGTMV